MKTLKLYSFVLLFCGIFSASAAPKSYTVASPDGKITVEIKADEDLTYLMRHEGNVIVDESVVALTLADGTVIGASPRITSAKKNHIVEDITAPLYRQKEFTSKANEIVLKMKNGFSLRFRAYDEGVAYRFETSRKEETVITADRPEGYGCNRREIRMRGAGCGRLYRNHYPRTEQHQVHPLLENAFLIPRLSAGP